ncbi:MAG: FecR domain-containing protein [Bacteroidales bacterium]
MNSALLGKYIFNEATERERARVEAWLAEDASNRKELEQLKKKCSLATQNYRYGAFDPQKASAAVFRNPVSRSRLTGHPLFRKYPFHIAASIALLLLIGLGAERYYHAPVSFVASGNSASELILPDQSIVKLAPGSKLTYPRHFSRNHRSVYLDGKGYFEVKPDAGAPFRIKSAQSTLEVLGTVFQMQADKKQYNVFVKSGKVRYESLYSGQQLILTANQGAVIDPGSGNLAACAVPVNQFSWATRELEFDETPLWEVIESINAAYGVILKKDEATRSLRLTGRFRNLELDQLISLIENTLGVTIQRAP